MSTRPLCWAPQPVGRSDFPSPSSGGSRILWPDGAASVHVRERERSAAGSQLAPRAGGDWAIEGREAARGARRKGGRLCTTVCSSALTRTRAIQLGEDEPTWERRWAMRRIWCTYMGAYLTDRSPGAAYTYAREGRVRAQE